MLLRDNYRCLLFLQLHPQAQGKHLLTITTALLPSAVLAQQFTPEQMLDVMTKSPENRDVRVHDDNLAGDQICTNKDKGPWPPDKWDCQLTGPN